VRQEINLAFKMLICKLETVILMQCLYVMVLASMLTSLLVSQVHKTIM
jgi:hypothetical protein